MRIDNWTTSEQQAFQISKLIDLKDYLLSNSAFYQKQWQSFNCGDIAINHLSDLQKFPTTCKEDIQQFESDFFCVPYNKIREYNTTSGTLGKPISIPLTYDDLNRLAYNEQCSFEKLNIEEGEGVQLMLTHDRLFMAGMSYYNGLKNIGATIIRTGAGVPQLQWDAIFRYKPTTLVAVPSFLIKMIDYAQHHGIDYKNSSVKKVLAIGESLKNENLEGNKLYQSIIDQWPLQLFSTYASTEMQTAFTECEYGIGGHLHADLLVVEIIDENGNCVAPGEIGEVCITTLGVEAMPLWRYKTGDMARLMTDTCKCGRTTPRLSGIIGRKNHMLKVKGTTIYPSAIFEALHHYNAINNYVVEVRSNSVLQDELHIYLTLDTDDTINQQRNIAEYLRSKLKLVPEIHITDEATLKMMQFPEMSRKQIKFVDNRVK